MSEVTRILETDVVARTSEAGVLRAQESSAAFKSNLGSQVSATAGTTLVITTTAAIDIDDLVVVRVVSDNTSNVGPTYSCTDSGGNTYTTQAHRVMHVGGVAQSGVAGAIIVSKATTAIASGGTITVTLSASTPAKAAYAESYTGVETLTRSAAVTAAGSSTSPTVMSGTVTANDLVLGLIGVESRTAFAADADSLNGSWSAQTLLANASGGTDTSRVEVAGQYKIPGVAGSQTFNTTLAASGEWIALITVLQPSGPPLETGLPIDIVSTISLSEIRQVGYVEFLEIDIVSTFTSTVNARRSSLALPININSTISSTDQHEETVRIVSIVFTMTLVDEYSRYLDYALYSACPTHWARFASGGSWQNEGPTSGYGGPLMHRCALPWNHKGEHHCGCTATVAKPAVEGRVAPPSETVDPIAALTSVAET